MNPEKAKRKRFRRRQLSVRRSIFGTPDRPRLAVYRSLTNMYAQIVDDMDGRTLVAANTQMAGVAEELGSKGTKEAAEAVGKAIAERALEQGIKKVRFDRRGYKYHGRVKALADAARAGGLDF